jgi:hypothetical protein
MNDSNSILRVVSVSKAPTVSLAEVSAQCIFTKLEQNGPCRAPYLLQPTGEYGWVWMRLDGLRGMIQTNVTALTSALEVALDNGDKVFQLRNIGDLADWLKLVHERKI